GQRRLGLAVCVPGYGWQASSRLARHGHDARRTDYHRLAARFLGPAVYGGPTPPLRPRRAVRRQCLAPAAPRPRGAALAEPPRRLLR
nr:hypothetical protein [Tanacetum cinerariifolium]